MEHRSDADMGPEVLRIGRDREKGVGCCSKQDAIDDRLVLISDIGNLLWQRKYHMEIRHRKQIGFTCGKPFPRRCALALRAVSINGCKISYIQSAATPSEWVESSTARSRATRVSAVNLCYGE